MVVGVAWSLICVTHLIALEPPLSFKTIRQVMLASKYARIRACRGYHLYLSRSFSDFCHRWATLPSHSFVLYLKVANKQPTPRFLFKWAAHHTWIKRSDGLRYHIQSTVPHDKSPPRQLQRGCDLSDRLAKLLLPTAATLVYVYMDLRASPCRLILTEEFS
ncbi:hypothetical protein EDB19DRAFT_308092 [Suillus lakei]|nr:hypothetical protein EDB19DRAFT_308092 [Suillus lakei]